MAKFGFSPKRSSTTSSSIHHLTPLYPHQVNSSFLLIYNRLLSKRGGLRKGVMIKKGGKGEKSRKVKITEIAKTKVEAKETKVESKLGAKIEGKIGAKIGAKIEGKVRAKIFRRVSFDITVCPLNSTPLFTYTHKRAVYRSYPLLKW
jgi:hypothetical protein